MHCVCDTVSRVHTRLIGSNILGVWEVTCESGDGANSAYAEYGGWGKIFAAAFLLAAVLYSVGGIVFNMMSKGTRSWREAFPNRLMWLSLRGLVMDGVQVRTHRLCMHGAPRVFQ